jgi:hypothetical protein
MAADHIDTLSLSSGVSALSARGRALEYLGTERPFLSNRGLDGTMVELFFSVVMVQGQAQHPMDDDYLLQWRPMPDPVALSDVSATTVEAGDIRLSEVADVTWDDATITLELHPPFAGLQTLSTPRAPPAASTALVSLPPLPPLRIVC